jgi:phosphohistidine phosphatase
MDRTLYLLRHAKSSWDDPAVADHDRPLASRGRRACRMIAKHLRSEGIRPALVLCSSAARSRETLERIGVGSGGPGVRIEIEAGLYGACAGDLLGRLRELGDIDSVMLIGHQPAIGELATSLALRRALGEKFPTAALATLRFRGSWSELSPGAAELVAFVKPRDLEGPREGSGG